MKNVNLIVNNATVVTMDGDIKMAVIEGAKIVGLEVVGSFHS
jgi:hypothetical protein